MPEKPYHPKTVVRKILDVLSESEVETPTGIARKIGYNPKTVAKYIELLEDLKMVECKEVPVGHRRIKACSLRKKVEE